MNGIDTSTKLTQATAAALKAEGFLYAGRYLVPNVGQLAAKALTREEAQDISDAGMQIFSIYETTAARARLGAEAGLSDGKIVRQLAKDIGMPEDGLIYFAVDYDAQREDFAQIEAYLRAAASACAPFRVGVYGSRAVIDAMFERGAAEAYWQCIAWSYGEVSPHADMYQRKGNTYAGGVLVDLNTAYNPDLVGLWSLNPTPKWYDAVMARAKRDGINDGTRPQDPATRAEVTQMLYNYIDRVQPEDDKTVSGLLTDE